MSGMRNQNVNRSADFPKQPINFTLVTAISQTGVVAFKFLPGYKFRIVRARSYCLLKAGVVTGNLKVGTRTAAAITFTSATEVALTLGTLINTKGSATEAITIEYTTDGSGVLTNGQVHLFIRAWPLNGDIGRSS